MTFYSSTFVKIITLNRILRWGKKKQGGGGGPRKSIPSSSETAEDIDREVYHEIRIKYLQCCQKE